MATAILVAPRQSVHRGMATWFLALGVAVNGCGQSAEWESLPEGYEYAPMQWPVAWSTEGHALVVVHLERGTNESGGLVLCRRSGVYRSVEDHKSELLFPMSSDMCLLDLRPETTGGVAGSPTLVVGGRDSLTLIDLREGHVSGVSVVDLSLRQYATLSPDARLIAMVATPHIRDETDRGADCLYVIGAAGSGVRRVTCFDEQRVRSTPTWSPDMAWVALSLSENSGGPIRSDGKVVIVEMATGRSNDVASGYFPSWSPDGAWIAYLSVPVVATAQGKPTLNSQGSVLRLVRPSGAEDHAVFASPGTASGSRVLDGWAWPPVVWSPDGARLAFSRIERSGSGVWEMSISGSGLRRRALSDMGPSMR